MDINALVLSDKALDAIDNGVWVDDLPGAEGVRLKVTGLGSQDAKSSLREKQAKMRLKNGGKPLSEEQIAQSMREVLAENVLKDWSGLTDDGNEVPYSQELAAKWLTSRNGERFAGLVLTAAQKVDSQASELVKEVVKN